MAKVILTPAAQSEYAVLPRAIQVRVAVIIQRLANWPNVSGAKPLRGQLSHSHGKLPRYLPTLGGRCDRDRVENRESRRNL